MSSRIPQNLVNKDSPASLLFNDSSIDLGQLNVPVVYIEPYRIEVESGKLKVSIGPSGGPFTSLMTLELDV